MNRIAVLGIMAVVAVGFAACDSPDATGPETASLEARGAFASGRAPLAATQDARRPVTGYIDGRDEYGDACGDGQGVLITSTGTGTVSHFGNVVMVSTSCVNLSDFSSIGPTPFSLKAANGDEAGGVVTSFVYTSYGFDLYTSITWGTGRFTGATGELLFPTNSTYTGVWTSRVKGWITY